MSKKSLLRKFILIFIFTGSLTSCKIGTKAVKSDYSLPDTFSNNQQKDTANIALLPWDIFYKDSTLVKYLNAALTHNQDLKIARDQTHLSLAQFKMVKRNFLPAIEAQAGSSVRKFGDYTMDGVGNEDTNKSASLPEGKRLPDPVYKEWFGGLFFNWEADIWGKLSNQRKGELARYLASREFAQGVTTWLVSEVAINYYELIGLDQEKKVLEENLRLQELGLELIKIQKAGGRVNQLAVDQFEAQLLNTRTQIVEVEQNILSTEAKINELLGRFPERIDRQPISVYDAITETFVGTPSQLITNRPDIRQAEFELTAAHADVNAARAAFYPALRLSGGAGLTAFDLSKLFLMPQSAAYNLAAGVSAPLFQQGQIRALYEASNVRQRIALTNYEKTLLISFHEVYRSVNAFDNLRKQIELKRREVEVLTRAFDNSHDLFNVGYATYLEVITAQRSMLEAELELTRLRKDKLKILAALYRALGGGWK